MTANPTGRKSLLLLPIVLCIFSCAVFQPERPAAPEHPVLLDREPVCTECHVGQDDTVPYARFNHGPDFAGNHRLAARQQGAMCRMCHTRNFCSRCHGGRTGLVPPAAAPERTGSRMPHRGDFLARHQIEGRINPVSCYRCHGTPETAEGCVQCHG